MITVTEYKQKKVGVFGLGKTGDTTVASLLAGGTDVYAWDDNQHSIEKSFPHSRLILQNFTHWPWSELKALILSPGVPLTHPKPHPVVEMANKYNCPVIGDIELLYRACPRARYIGITGTNGKSTTTTLIGHILKTAGLESQVGGNLGTAALSLKPLAAKGTYVLELSSYQLDLIKSTCFNIAVLLNITPDHIDRHGNMNGYIRAKKHIFERQEKGDVAVIAVDDTHTQAIAENFELKTSGREVVRVSVTKTLEQGIYVKEGVLHDRRHEPFVLRNISTIPTLTGKHNWQNAAVAWAAARACGISPEVIYKALQTFPGLSHRLQLVTTSRGVRFINDSKATNADATANALAPYKHIYWIAGGKPKEGGIEPLAKYFPHIAHAFLIGEAEKQFAKILKKGKVPHTLCGTLDVAVRQAAKMAFAEKKTEAVVLLSPACASFDQFKNFEERGDKFCELVEGITHAA
jgi:UDP-N-acetylmuramoylalanine--D-glutamate ligase